MTSILRSHRGILILSPLARTLSRPQCRSLQKSLHQRLAYATHPQPSAKAAAEAAAKRRAAASHVPPKLEIPERLLIYHAGAGRTAFVAIFKVSALFISAFFLGVFVPSYINSGKSIEATTMVAAAGLVPLTLTTLITSTFVTHIHLHLPAEARTSKVVLDRFLARPQTTSLKLTLTTMSFIAKPRHSTLNVTDLVTHKARFGLVNFIRTKEAAKQENTKRKWYMYRAVDKFYIMEGRPGQSKPKARYQTMKPDPVSWSVWEMLKAQISRLKVQI